MSRLWKFVSSVVSAWLLGLGVLCPPVAARDVSLALSPQKISLEAGKWSLLPPEKSLVDGDAVPLYEQAVKALPDKAGDDQIQKWRTVPTEQLPLDEVEQVVSTYMESLKCVARAVRCRQCNWPEWKPGMELTNLSEYRRIAFAIHLWARMEIADKRYEGAVSALQMGFGMGRHIGQGPTLVQGLVGVAVGAVMCSGVEELAQREGTPNLYRALASLPRPFIDMEKAIESERTAALSSQTPGPLRDQLEAQLKPAHDRTRLLMKRFDSHLAALQCVEAIRSYAASHDGQLPGALADITEVSVPKDPMGDGPFQYTRTGSTAVLESALPSGGNEKDKNQFQLSVKK